MSFSDHLSNLAKLPLKLWDDYTGNTANKSNVDAQRSINTANIIAQKEANELGRKWSLEDWNSMNAYNHPTQVMQRLREAGINPHLAVGGALTAASPVKTIEPKTADLKAPVINPVRLPDLVGMTSDIYDMSQKKISLENTQANTRLINQETINKTIEAAGKTTGNQRDALNLKLDQDLYESRKRSGELKPVKTEAEINSLNFDWTTIKPEIAKELKQKIALAEKQNKLHAWQVMLMESGISPNSPWYVKTAIDLWHKLMDK